MLFLVKVIFDDINIFYVVCKYVKFDMCVRIIDKYFFLIK